jgi:hypothetical protein
MRLRWFQFRLRTLLLLTFVLAAGLGGWNAYVAPYRQQRRVMAAIERAGGSFESRATGPAWLRRWFGEGRFQDITSVSLLCEDGTRKCLDGVLRLPQLESLYVAGRSFTDEHVVRLSTMTTLKEVDLDDTAVTRAAVDLVQEARPELAVHIGLSFEDLMDGNGEHYVPFKPAARLREWLGKRVRIPSDMSAFRSIEVSGPGYFSSRRLRDDSPKDLCTLRVSMRSERTYIGRVKFTRVEEDVYEGMLELSNSEDSDAFHLDDAARSPDRARFP